MRLGEHVLRDHADVVYVLLDECEGYVARAAHGDAVGHGAHDLQGDGMSGEERGWVRRRTRRLRTDDLDIRALRGDSERDSGKEPAAAGAHDDSAHVGHLLEDLQSERALSRDDVGVIERRDEDGPRRLGEGSRLDDCLVERGAVEAHIRAVIPGGDDLGHAGRARHEDRGADAQHGRREGDTLGVIPG